MEGYSYRISALILAAVMWLIVCTPAIVSANVSVATTTLFISICGDTIVNAGEDCDIPTDTGQYSTTIAGRQCTNQCRWAPYCGDGILQTIYGEQCDDGNNDGNDFCSSDCTRERADAGGGSTGGGGSSSSGGRDAPLGDTRVSVTGRAFPNTTVTILLDGNVVGNVRTNNRGEFLFTVGARPGTATMGFWALDSDNTRSTTFNTTFDITQGAVTNVSGVLIPPTIRSSASRVNPGEPLTLSGQTVPNATVEISINNAEPSLRTTSDAAGRWSASLNTNQLLPGQYTVKARFVEGTTLRQQSTYGAVLGIAIGVEGRVASNSDLNRDGKVNLTDFSILIFWWGTPGGNSNPPADINQNGRVGLEDFSILLFNWTG